jgi:mono/diheme cytochrome c family protein
MSKIRERINYLLYLIALVAAIVIVYQAFTTGFKKGEFEGKYYPPAEKRAAVEEEKPADLRLLRIETPELLALGQKQFKLNCASCHGNSGTGDGPKAATLNPPPRNFTTEKFKKGASVLQIYNTLATGVTGTSMPSFDLLPEENRMAMAHYVRTFVPDSPDDPQELIDALPVVSDDTQAATPTDSTQTDSTAKQSVTIPVDQAIKIYLDENRMTEIAVAQPRENQVFIKYCASCHGESGEGKLWVDQIGPASAIYLKTKSMSYMPAKLKDKITFVDFISKGSPGMNNHRFGLLTRDEINELFDYMKNMRQE